MSGRTSLRFALAGMLSVAFAAPAMTQEGGFQVPLNAEPVLPVPATSLPEAPMPREAGDVMRLIHTYNFEALRASLGLPALAPMPRERGYCCVQLQTLRADLYELAVMPQPVPPPMTPPTPPATDTNVQNRQVFNFSIGLFGGDGSEPPANQPAPMTPPTPCPTPGFYRGNGETIMGSMRTTPAQPPACVPHISSGVPITWSAVFPAVAPASGSGTTGVKVIEVVALETCPPCPFPAIAPNPLLGTWYRESPLGMIGVTFTRDEMKLCVSQHEKGALVTITVTAHYTITKDGLVYGAITGADVDVKPTSKGDPNLGMELAELSLSLQELADRPFSFRTKATSAGLMVSQLKAASFEGISGKDLMILGGLYKCAKDGQVPAPVSVKSARTSKCEIEVNIFDAPVIGPPSPYVPVPAARASEPIQRIGVDFSMPVVAPPRPNPWTQGPPCPTPPRSACDDPMKSMAAEAFGQMIRGGMTLPSPRYLEHYPQYFAPDPVFPLPRELASQEEADRLRTAGASLPPAPIKPGMTGTWVREIGSKRCVVKIVADHVTVTVSEAHEQDGKTAIGHLTFTADYHLTRDGMTAVGLLTSVDMKIEGDLAENDSEDMVKQLGEMQKALEDKPFAMTFRVYGDVLVIGNVRMPSVGDRMDTEPSAYVGGRYKAVGDKPLPKLKATKATEPRPLPSYDLPAPPLVPAPGVYGPPTLPPGGVYLPPSSVSGPVALPPVFMTPAPVNRDLPLQTIPASSLVRPVDVVIPAPRSRTAPDDSWAPPMSAPVRPTPTMPQPVAPGVSLNVDPKPMKTPARFTLLGYGKYAISSNLRMDQLLYSSEDLRQIQNEWRRFWFNDPPSHLTPERIHGGIY